MLETRSALHQLCNPKKPYVNVPINADTDSSWMSYGLSLMDPAQGLQQHHSKESYVNLQMALLSFVLTPKPQQMGLGSSQNHFSAYSVYMILNKEYGTLILAIIEAPAALALGCPADLVSPASIPCSPRATPHDPHD